MTFFVTLNARLDLLLVVLLRLIQILLTLKAQAFDTPWLIIKIRVEVRAWPERIFFVFYLIYDNTFYFVGWFFILLIFWVVLIDIIFTYRHLVEQGYLVLLLLMIDNWATRFWISCELSKLGRIWSIHWATFRTYQRHAGDCFPFFHELIFDYKLSVWIPFVFYLIWKAWAI